MTAHPKAVSATHHGAQHGSAFEALVLAADAGLDPFVEAAVSTFGASLTIACSFGVEDIVVLDAVATAAHDRKDKPTVFLLDTGRLHQETFDLVERVRDRYGLPISVYAPSALDVETLVNTQGTNGFYASVDARKECCRVRKVVPLTRALAKASAWMTGLRRAQSVTRAEISPVEVDHAHGGILKLSPLTSFTEAEVWTRAKERDIPTHALHARGFPSIGCAPCTRAIQPGEDARAGRWWWENAEHKECGLHGKKTK